MATKVTISGVDIAGDASWGTHICLFYQTKKDLLEILVPYFKTGLENDEFCLWVTSDFLTQHEALKACRKAVHDFDEYLAKGQVRIISHTDWYLKHRSFGPQIILNGDIDASGQIPSNGYRGVKVAGNAAWLDKSSCRSVHDRQEAPDHHIAARPTTVICAYHLDKCEISEVMEAIKNHQFSLINHDGTWQLVGSITDLQGLAVTTDQQNQAQQVSKESEDKYRQLFDSTLDAMEVVDGETGTIVLANQAAAEIFGFDSPQDMVGLDPFEYIPAEDREWVAGMFAEYMLEKDLRKVVELRVITRDGREIWISAMGIRTEYQGRLAGLVSMREITDRKRAEEKLHASEENNRLLVDSATVGIAVVQDGVIKFANPKLAELAACTMGELISKPFTEFVHPDERQTVTQHYARRLKQEDAPPKYQFRALDKEGNTKWAEISPVLFDWEGKPAILAFLNDITERKRTEKDLTESERRYRLLAENSADVIWTMDMNMRLSYVSPSVTRMRGYSVKEAMQATVEEALTPESANIILKVIKDMASENKNFGQNSHTGQVLELQMLCKDGSTIWTETTISLIRKADGRPESILGVTRNITQRKQAEDDLLENERRYRLLAENITDVIWVTDMDLKPTYVSPSVSRLLGYSVEESLAGTLETVMPRSSVEKVNEAFTEVMALAEEQPDTIARPQVTELEFKRKDGSSVWLDTTASFIRDSSGRPVEIMGVLRDITQRRKAEEALRESEERFRHLIETTSDWVWETDENGIYTYVSPVIHEILGYQPEEVLGRTSADIMPSRSANRMAKVFGSAVISGTPFKFVEATYLHKDGRLIIAEISGVPFFDDAGTAVRGYRGIARDITQRKQAEEQLQKSYQNIQKMLEGTIQAITMMVETRDRYTAGHQQRVTQLACAIAQELGLSNKQIQMIRMAGRLHDLGKIFIPIEILSKPGQLNEMELAIIKTHPRASYDILKNIDFPWPIADIVLQHHERTNGSGYPAGLRGEDILMEARILAVSDVVEAMSSHRPYRPALGVETALKEIVQNKGILYDPDVVNACLRVFWEKRLVLGEEPTAAYSQ